MRLKSWYFGRREIEFGGWSGEVVGSSKYSETHVSSKGGGGYLHRGSGYVAAAQVSSTITTNHEFWIRMDDGSEKAFQFQNKDIPLREGQRITVVAGSAKKRTVWPYVGLKNHNAKQWWAVGSVDDLLKDSKFFRSWGSRVFWPAIAYFVVRFGLAPLLVSELAKRCVQRTEGLCMLVDPTFNISYQADQSLLAWIAAIASLVAMTIWKTIRYGIARTRLKAHIHRVMDEV